MLSVVPSCTPHKRCRKQQPLKLETQHSAAMVSLEDTAQRSGSISQARSLKAGWREEHLLLSGKAGHLGSYRFSQIDWCPVDEVSTKRQLAVPELHHLGECA